MNKTIPGILVGLLLGAGATFLILHSRGGPPAADAAKSAEAKAADAAPEPEPGTVHLETDDQEKADIQTAQPTVMEYKPETKGYARVLDPAMLASELSDIAAASAAADASARELARLQSLKATGNASDQAIETADAAAKHDQAQLTAARAKLLSDWGPTLAGRADLTKLAFGLLARESALVRIDIPGGEKLPPAPLSVQVVPAQGEGEPAAVEMLGPAPMADAQAQGSAFIALLNQPAPPTGTMLIALITGGGDSQQGFRLPGKAIIRYEGDTFVYAQTNSEDFERWRVKIGAELRDGAVFVTSGVTAQDHIVVNGAAQLLSEELKAATGGP
ncbi:MAG TPA: hypothetical protein VHC95_13620 [Opitutales bacterium]|nr:hypothetical protein [Opitutales bacterium]